MRQVALLVLVMACKQTTDDYPVDPGHNTMGGGGDAGAGVTDGGATGDGAGQIAGQVCVLTDPRDLGSCRATGNSGFTVTLGTGTATTTDTGAFTIASPTGTNLLWHVTGSTIQTSVMAYGNAGSIPVMLAADYLALETGNGVNIQNANDGEIFARVAQAGQLLTQAHGDSSPAPFYGVLYDTNIADVWNINASVGTGAHGMLWFPATPIGTATITVTPRGGAAHTTPNVPVESQAITYVNIAVP